MTYDLYLLPPPLKPCEHVDSTDTCYLNQTYAPLVNPLKRALDIELYNGKRFNKSLQISTTKLMYDHNTLKFPDESFPPFPSLSELHEETDTCLPKQLIEPEDYSLSPPLLLLHYIIHSLILIVFSSFAIFLRKL